MLQLEEEDFDIAQEEPMEIQGLDFEHCQIESRIREQQDEQRARDNNDIDDNTFLYQHIFNNPGHKEIPPKSNIVKLHLS